MPRSLLVLSLVCLPAGAIAAPGSPEWPLVPGRMGYNALPVLANVDPVLPLRAELELGGAAQVSGLDGADAAATPYFRLTVPFREVAALEVEGTPLELFRTRAVTQARLDARDRSGVASGDLRFGARFLLHAEGRAPALGLRLVVKSTTGKALHSRRFTNAPGYEIDFLAGRALGAAGPVRLRALARLGLAVWQFGPDRQDDALTYGATLRATARGGASLGVEWRGYAGWRFDDRPSLVGLAASVPVRGVELGAALNHGLSSEAPPLELRLGATFGFDVPGLARSRAPSAPPPHRAPTPPVAAATAPGAKPQEPSAAAASARSAHAGAHD